MLAGAVFSWAFVAVFGFFVVAMVVLTVLTVRFIVRRDRSRRS
jgi:membrane protein implicated in regulation of membrane protease activity